MTLSRARGMAAAAMALPLLVLAALDLGLSALGEVPPEDPLVFYARTFEAGFSPFVVDGDAWSIRPDWRGDGSVRVKQGAQEGEVFILPGFRAVRVPRDKAPGSLRVFVVGGSAVHGVGLAPELTLPAQLQQRLAAALPGRKVAVHNLGCPGWASDRVRALVDTLLTMQPDAIVVHSGHNELLRGAPDPLASLGPLARWRLRALRYSALFRWLDHVAGANAIGPQLGAEGERWTKGVATSRAAETVDPAARASYLSAAPERYRDNLLAMARRARRAEVPMVFLLPAANLRFPPRSPTHPPDSAHIPAYEAALQTSQRAFQSGDMAASLAALDRAVGLSPGHGLAHFGRGLTLLALDRRVEALSALRQARDLDTWTHRITTPLEAAFGAAMADGGTPFLDARQVVDPLAPQRTSQFTDHCHLIAAAHAALAEALVPLLLPTM